MARRRLGLLAFAVLLGACVLARDLPPHCMARDERSGVCVCERGYAGPRCQECARGAVRRYDGTCVMEMGIVHDDIVEERRPRPHGAGNDHDDDDGHHGHWRGGDNAHRGDAPPWHAHLSEGEAYAVTMTTVGLALVAAAILVLIAVRALAILRAAQTLPETFVERGDYGTDDEQGSGEESDDMDGAGMGDERQPFLAGPSQHGQRRRHPTGTRPAGKGDGL